MKINYGGLLIACIAVLALAGCGKDQSSSDEPGKTTAAASKKVVEEKVAPYTYAAPVKGHYKDINLGEFDLVDGIAYPAAGGNGTVVYVISKPIASPLVSDSVCPMMLARTMTEIRTASYHEVTIANGVAKYFIAGNAFDGSSYEQAASYQHWPSRMKIDADRAVGGVVHRPEGGFDFDLPLAHPKINEVSRGDQEKTSSNGDPTAPRPTEQAANAAYKAVHDAALKKNYKAMLAALGFDSRQNAAIRGLDGIDADLAIYADRFLSPGTPNDFSAKPGTAYVKSEGVNSKGKKFANYYHFASCGDHFVLVSIAENPL